MPSSPKLFSDFTLRDVTFRNRIFVSPMCQYSARDGIANEWHMVHLGSRAVGGAGLVMVEATAIQPEGRISGGDLGLWNNAQMDALRPIARFIKDEGSIPAIQLAHAGRKGAGKLPWAANPTSVWTTVGPSPIPFSADYAAPHELTNSEISRLIIDFVAAAKRALSAGFEVLELHMAHGYLLHEFLSPLSNHRTDDFGGSLTNRMRFPLEVTRAVRAVMPSGLPLFVRISATDWVPGGWDIDESITFSKELKALGVDLIDCSSGGTAPDAQVPVRPAYQVPFAKRIRTEAQIATGAVGLITSGIQAEEVLTADSADVIFIGREFLRDPYFPLHAAKELNAQISWPKQYERGR